jgi:hypothetical protein
VVGAAGLVAGAVALAGNDVLTVFGNDAVVFRSGVPNVGHFLYVLVRELAGTDLLVGVVPFGGALLAAFVFVRSDRRQEHVAFAAVATAVSGWLLVEVAYYGALFDNHELHQRLLIYVVPFFLIALIAVCRPPASNVPIRVGLIAAAIAALLPAAIPFDRVVDQAVLFEAPGVQLFARGPGLELEAVPHATLVAAIFSAALALLYVRVRSQWRAVVLLVLVPFVATWGLSRARIEEKGDFARTLLPQHVDWVDRAAPRGDVVLLGGRMNVAAEQLTAYSNLSIARVYYFCAPVFDPEFGERKVAIDAAGRLRGPTGFLKAPLVVSESALGIRGRILSYNVDGRQTLVATDDARVVIPPVRLAGLLRCEPQTRS